MTDKLNKSDKVYTIAFLVIVLVSSLVGVYFLYFSNIRGLTNDLERINRINSINSKIENYYNYRNENIKLLPINLNDVKNYQYSYYNDDIWYDPKDRSNTKEFEYKKGSGVNYQICADFEAGTDAINKYKNYVQSGGGDVYYVSSLETDYKNYSIGGKFEFKSGYQCLDFKVRDFQNRY